MQMVRWFKNNTSACTGRGRELWHYDKCCKMLESGEFRKRHMEIILYYLCNFSESLKSFQEKK